MDMAGKSLVLYWSGTGNTEKVTKSLCEGLKRGGSDDIAVIRIPDDGEVPDVDYFGYDLVCFGFPSYSWTTPEPVTRFLNKNLEKHKAEGRVVPGAPATGKQVLLYCTYCGVHTGIREAVPAVKFAGQFFEHVGFTVVDEWYILSEHVGGGDNNILGRMGDVRGLPDEASLKRVETQAYNLIQRL